MKENQFLAKLWMLSELANGILFSEEGGEFMKKQNYLFLGSSITYGAGGSGISVANMFAEDYAQLEYDQYIEGQHVSGVKYLRRLTTPTGDNLDGWQGTYRCGDISLVVNGDDTATFNSLQVVYTLNGDTATMKQFDNYGSFIVKFNQGGNVYKVACNGYKLAYATTASSPKSTSYNYLLEVMINQRKLMTSNPDNTGIEVKDYDGQKIDQVFIQLSTNDAGQTDTVFGDINAEEIDCTTSYGGIRYLIKLCKETWGEDCKITFFVCPQSDMTGSCGTRYVELREGLLALKDKYQDFDILDLWSNDEITYLVRGANYLTYLMPDKVHPTEMGYEGIFFPEFRKYMDSKSIRSNECLVG
jgi:hypothetical protein